MSEFVHYFPTDLHCNSGFLSPSDLRQMTLDVNINRLRERDNQQRLFPDIWFSCNGSITKWIVGAEVRGGTHQPELQIWRRDSVRGNSYTKANFSLLTPNVTSNPNVHEYYPDTPLEFQEGDILGVYQPEVADSQLVVYYQDNTGPRNYRQNNIDPPAPLTFTNTGDLQYDYPLVTVEISTGKCSIIVFISICCCNTVFSQTFLLLLVKLHQQVSI